MHSLKGRSELVIADLGCGNGLLGIFAKYCGFKKVYCIDTDPMFVEAARALSEQLSIHPITFIAGDVHALKNAEDRIDITAATDVIEHIYDLDNLLKTLNELNTEMISVFTTASNPENYFKVKKLRRLQLRDELEGFKGNAIDTEAHVPYLAMREKIIADHFKQSDEKMISVLAKACRGLNEADIITACMAFVDSGKIPKPADKYNTCDPRTGSWSERVLSLETYRSAFERQGFSLSILNGFFDDKGNGLKKWVNRLRNMFIPLLGKKISPFISLTGYKK